MHDMNTKFATVSITAKDIKRLKPEFSDEKCLQIVEVETGLLRQMLREKKEKILKALLSVY